MFYNVLSYVLLLCTIVLFSSSGDATILHKEDRSLNEFKYDSKGKLIIEGGFRELLMSSLQLGASAFHSQKLREQSIVPITHEWETILSEIDLKKYDDNTYGPYEFIPVFMSLLGPKQNATWTTPCFQRNSAHINFLSEKEVSITIETEEKISDFCDDYYLIATRKTNNFKSVFMRGSHSVSIELDVGGQAYDDLVHNRLKIFWLPLGLEGSIASLYHTLQLFRNSEHFQETNIRWLESISPQFNFAPRQYDDVIFQNEDEIPSGTHLVISRFDGFESAIMWGTGSSTGHHAIAFRDPEDGQLYVHESTDVPPGTDIYWPSPYGIIRTPFKQWLEQAKHAKYSVDMLILSDEYQQRFNDHKANEFFKSVQGLPYGYHTFIYEWIDADIGNLPWKPTEPEIASLLFDLMDNFISNTSKLSVFSLILQGLSKRLNNNFYSMDDLWHYLNVYGGSDPFDFLAKAIDMPELDRWTYWNPSNSCTNRANCTGKSMVCDVLVANIYKAAGVFGDLSDEIQAGEFTPSDAYKIHIYNGTWVGPKGCDFIGFCQIMGKYRLPLPGFNTLDLYPHMNEKCAALPPQYERSPSKC